jgi:tetratricopeptide (TPR) repeat protein
VLLSQHRTYCRPDSLTLGDRITRLEANATELRRDQLNYQIERDLLKEAYASNYQTINIVLTIILGVFSFIGFLGIRDIGTIRKQYMAELVKLNDLRRDFETKINQYTAEQSKVKEEFFSIVRTNEEQNRRIKVLELQEKVGSLMTVSNYRRAYEYIIPALEMDPKNVFLLDQKARCLWQLGDLPGAITSFSKVLEIDDSNVSAITNLLELFLLTSRIDEFVSLYSKWKTIIQAIDNSAVSTYLEVLEAYQRNKPEEMKRLIRQYVLSITPDKQVRTRWNFADVKKTLNPDAGGIRGALLLLLIQIMSGEIDRDEAIKRL